VANRNDARNPSRQLAELLRAEIDGMAAETRLASYRELAERHGFARNTVQTAVRLLEAEGVVEIRGTAGVFVRDQSTGTGSVEGLRADLASVQQQLTAARQVLADTEAAVEDLLRKLPAELPAEG
jgi:GntR family transcriptional regulator